MLVQMRDVAALVRTHSLRADVVAHRLFLAVDLIEGSSRVLLPVNFITVDLKEQEQVCKGMRQISHYVHAAQRAKSGCSHVKVSRGQARN